MSLVDLFGTLTDLSGLPKKTDIDSRSFVTLLRDPKAAWPHAAITHLDNPQNYAISTDRWRYIHYVDGGEELYDIASDPYEWTNLATKSEHAEKLSEMRLLAPTSIAPIHESQPGINSFRAEIDLTLTTGQPAPPSKDSSNAVKLLFLNQTQKSLKITWIDESGMKQDVTPLVGASRRLINSYSGHTLVVERENGEVLGHIIVPDKPAQLKIE